MQVPGQSAPITATQAIQQGVLKAGLLTLGGSPTVTSRTLEPWTGYWVKATRSVTLLVPPPGTTASASQAQPPAWDPKRDAPPAVPEPAARPAIRGRTLDRRASRARNKQQYP